MRNVHDQLNMLLIKYLRKNILYKELATAICIAVFKTCEENNVQRYVELLTPY